MTSKKKKIDMSSADALKELRNLQLMAAKFKVSVDSAHLGEFSSELALKSRIKSLTRFVSQAKGPGAAGVKA